jgi:acyl-coenzyme A synthetase/AMP-(fatty) acid ligase
VAFDVNDGFAGFPASVIDDTPFVEMKVEDRSLKIRSDRNAIRYIGDSHILKDAEGFVDTGDIVELRDDRYYFVGRRDGVINVGGWKVYPEEVEAVINRHCEVQVSLVRTKKNPITGALVVADVVLKTPSQAVDDDGCELKHDILLLCREALSPYKVPAVINFVPALPVDETGKLARRHA